MDDLNLKEKYKKAFDKFFAIQKLSVQEAVHLSINVYNQKKLKQAC